MNKKYIMDYPKHYSNIKTGRSSLSDWLNKNYPDFYNYLCNTYPDIDIKVAVYMFYNGITEIPLCVCGNPVKFHGYQHGFAKFCCPSCAGKDESVRSKLKKTLIEKYGNDYQTQITNKGKETKLLKYGDANYNNVEKAKQTCIERYDVDNPMKLKKNLEKAKQTCIERYGNEYFLKSQQYMTMRDECLEKAKQTCIERYGGPAGMSNSEIKNKVRQTCLEKYGVEWNCMRPEAKNSRNYNSGPNEFFANLLTKFNINYEREFYLDGKSYDFKIDNNLIEINPSPTHNINWNPYGGKIIDKYYHLIKSRLAKEHGYNIINVWDWDDLCKIIYLIIPKKQIFARKCILKKVNIKDCDDFLNKYHIQNTCKGQTIRLGLYYEDLLIAVMTFGKPRYNKKYEWELLRLCYHKDYKVIGGTKKLFNYFVQNYSPHNIISYCDDSKFNGRVYNMLGFVLKNNNIQPSKHWYNCKSKNHITDNLLRQRGFDQLFGTKYGKGVNNQDLMKENGFVEIYDAGQSVYEWQNNSKKP